MKIHDISLTITSGMMVYPGNPKPSIEAVQTMPKDASNLSLLTLGSHTGTHVDAPLHADNKGFGVEGYDLAIFLGRCRVLDMTSCQEAVGTNDLEKVGVKAGERLLFKTQNSLRGFETWRDDYIYLSGDAAEYLKDKAVRLVGIDALSVKQRGSRDLRPHTVLLGAGIAVVEGLDLSRVEPGGYTFVGLPLKLSKIDGAPLRAVLIEGKI